MLAERPIVNKNPRMPLKGRILVVDDHVELAENIAEILEAAGYGADVVVTAEQALERLAGGPYRGVITDFRLPGCSGVELVVKLRDAGHRLPVVMVSAFAEPAVVEQAEQAGALEVLSKPVDFGRLFTLIEQFDRESGSVLIVDDNHELAEDLAEALRGAGAQVFVSGSAEQALSRRVLPRVALVDVRLPDKSGIDVARQLCARDPTIQLVFMTGHAEEASTVLEQILPELEKRANAPELLTKPVDVETLVIRVSKAAGI